MTVTNTAVKGTTLALNSTVIGQVQSIDGAGYNVGKRDITILGSAVKEYAPSIGDPQPIGFTCVYKPQDAGQQKLTSRCASPSATLDTFLFTLPSAKTISVSGFITKAIIKAGDVEGTYILESEIQPSGAITVPTTT